MNPINPRFLSSMYRKEPIPSFLVTIGLVNAIIGGLNDRTGLFSLGLATVGGAILGRWRMQQKPTAQIQPKSQIYLSAASSDSVPTLKTPKRKRSI
ncbi:hypothetical protein C7B70_16510 [Chlorogloea sp. CCALA 695]|nr:hypothetical protein C7B70_16510 [Chlorogloea sp. CCALA 695]